MYLLFCGAITKKVVPADAGMTANNQMQTANNQMQTTALKKTVYDRYLSQFNDKDCEPRELNIGEEEQVSISLCILEFQRLFRLL